jgi:transcriptional regulator of acetoin/glycerol metabolism
MSLKGRPQRRKATGPAIDDGLARSRVQFLASEPVDTDKVRQIILASWSRSREFQVPADHIDLPYATDRNLDTPLIRAAEPVLQRLGDQLDGQPISLILTDTAGVVLTQVTGDVDLRRHLEGVELAPGFSYGERFVGTNGIGTALEDGRPTYVFGHEHYAEHLENLACAGVPIQHPISGRTIGAIDLTCWYKDASRLLITLARTAGEQIRQALMAGTDIRDLALFQAYLQTCRRTSGIVMAFNDGVVMMNDRARQLLDPADQSVLLEHATQQLTESERGTTDIYLPTGNKARVHCHQVPGRRPDAVAGGVLRVELIDCTDEYTGMSGPILPMYLPGVVGSTPAWLRCCHDADDSYGRGEWLVLAGDSGSGKYSLARGVHQRRNPTGRMHTLDAANATGADLCADVQHELLEDPVDTLVIRHIDQLDRACLRELATVLRRVHSQPGPHVPWLAVTLTAHPDRQPDLAELPILFPRTVHVPPLRQHVEDLNELVPLLLSKLQHGGELTCSPAAMHLLMRANWPGNVEQVHQVLKQVVTRRRSGSIRPADLPAEYRTVARRSLNRLESVERDAIVQSLEDADGNKVRAARMLGISRATIYRKIHDYGIVTLDR